MEDNIFSEIQAKLKAPKNQFNKFGGYPYRSCEDILEAVKPLLNEYKWSITISDEVVQHGDRFYIKAVVTLFDDKGNVARGSEAVAREPESKKGMDASQITGATSSYARKYALNGLFAIDDTKDSDTMDNNEPAKASAKKPMTKKDFGQRCVSERDRIGENKYHEVLTSYQVNSAKDLDQSKWDELLKDLAKQKGE
jgi:hypothetical protein